MPKPLIKRLSYRLERDGQSDEAVAASMREHWAGFEWVSGPVVVTWSSPRWGQIQAWGVTEEEAKGVIRHAMAHQGSDESDGVWLVGTSKNARFGRVGTVRAATVQAREGSSGTGSLQLALPDAPVA